MGRTPRISFAVSETSTGLSGADERTIHEESVYVAFFEQIETELPVRRREANVRPPVVQKDAVTASWADGIDRNPSDGGHEIDLSASKTSDAEQLAKIDPSL